MNPYARFRLVSNSVSAAIILGALAVLGPPLADTVTVAAGGDAAKLAGAGAGAVAVLVVFWVTMTEAIFPALFRFTSVRRIILGKHYMEGTWLQSERGDDASRMSVIDIQPKTDGFTFTGYSLNENLEIESNSRIEFSKFDWPFMTYKHRNSLSDGSDGLSEGVGELQFEMNQSAARRYNGFLQYVQGRERLKIEGVKLTKGREIKHLRTLEGRREICAKYWELFYNRPLGQQARQPVAEPVAPIAPVDIVVGPPTEKTDYVDRRSEDSLPVANKTGVIPRRRATDWAKEDETSLANTDDGLDIDRIVNEAREEAEKVKTAVGGGDYRSRPAL
ncbi:MAG: hypothetical protein AAF216_09625 [Pseudomonadota bacterium]